jgi:phosphohistidine phosphatase
MKTLFLVRHAKAVDHSFKLSDFERPLQEQGKRDAEEMAGRLALDGIVIDKFITSTALRASTTCKIFAKALNTGDSKILEIDKLYNAPASYFYDVINDLDDTINSVAIFAHNPGITEMACLQTNPMEFIDMPTCGIFAVKMDIDSWQDFQKVAKERLFFKYPKQFL